METMIALVILAVALFALAMVPIMTSKLALLTARRERATALAVRELDVLEAKDPTEAVQTVVVVSGDYRVTATKPAYGAANYRATVTVEWGGITGRSTLTLERDLSRISDVTRGTK